MNTSKERPMIRLRQHAYLLYDASLGIGYDDGNIELEDMASYLRFASGIEGVQYSTGEFDCPWCCSGAMTDVERRDELAGAFAHNLSFFLACWSAIEVLKKEILPQEIPYPEKSKKRGLDNLCFFLSSNFKGPFPGGYETLIDTFVLSVGFEQEVTKKHVGSSPLLPPWLARAGEGLFRVCEVRNAFAHGDFSISIEGTPDKHPDILHLQLASRIVLVSIQMILLCMYDHTEAVGVSYLSRWTDDENPLRVGEFFLNMHRSKYIEDILDRGPGAAMELGIGL